jgi:hypothetical protein
MVGVRLEGRLGNQLFQYAFIYTAAKKLNTSFYLDKSVENFYLSTYFEVKNDFIKTLDNGVFSIQDYKNIFNAHLKRGFYGFLQTILFGGRLITISNEKNPSETFKELKNNSIYQGYFQSTYYFNDFEDEIRALYSIKKKYVAEFQQIKKRFSEKKDKVVIHVRRTDYVGLDYSLPVSYYKNAIENINSQDADYIFITDDHAFIEQEFSDIQNKYISTNSEIIDLQFLINADFCVLSNSSFSWWGAWLNNNQNKKVFAPKYWLGFKEKVNIPAGIADSVDFNWIEV